VPSNPKLKVIGEIYALLSLYRMALTHYEDTCITRTSSFVRSFIHSFIHVFIHVFIHSFYLFNLDVSWAFTVYIIGLCIYLFLVSWVLGYLLYG